MSDCRNDLIKSIEESLITVLSPDNQEAAVNKIIQILGDYEVVKRCTDLTVYDDTNDRILKRYCASMMVEGKSPKTIDGYRRQIRKLLDAVGRPVTEIGVYDIRFFLACEKERGVSNRTVENERSYIASFFHWLTTEEIIQKNPAAAIKPVKYTDKERKAFSSVELDALRHACKTLKERALLEMLVSSGVRISELTDMDVSDVNFSNGTIHIRHGKGDKERITYINDVAKVHIQKYLMSRGDNSNALFMSKNKERIKPGGVRFILNNLGKRAGVSNVHPHRFRRTFATGLAARGMPIQEIQRLLGHSDINTTLHYVCVDDSRVKASYQQFIA